MFSDKNVWLLLNDQVLPNSLAWELHERSVISVDFRGKKTNTLFITSLTGKKQLIKKKQFIKSDHVVEAQNQLQESNSYSLFLKLHRRQFSTSAIIFQVK